MKLVILSLLTLVLLQTGYYLYSQQSIIDTFQPKYAAYEELNSSIKQRLHKDFKKWEKEQGINFTNEYEEQMREVVFDIHELEIESENEKHKGEFVLKPNKFSAWTDEEMKQYQTGIDQNDDDEDLEPQLDDPLLQYAEQKLQQSSKLQAPQPVDYRKYDLGVKDQGSCGTCWAFATNTLLEANFEEKKLSEQHLADCVQDGRKDTGCHGMSRSGHQQFKFIGSKGVNYQSNYPYLARENRKPQCENKKLKFQLPQDSKIVSFEDFSKPQCEKLKAMVSEYGPTYVSVYSNIVNFMYYYDGIASHDLDASWVKTSSNCLFGFCLKHNYKVDHAVTLMGYTDDYWIVKNSWGEDWGKDGYIYIKMGNYFNICHKGFAIVSEHKKY